MKRRLITSALPYVNNEPHLGNLIQVLSADAFGRFCRMYGYDTLYICGTDEYGTTTESKAAEEGISPRELCDRYHDIHADIYKWFNIAFDKFGRTSTPFQTEVTQDIFLKLDKAGLVSEKTIEQFFCVKCERFLADRFIRGICPVCGSAEARGDQCEHCGKLLDPTDLKEPQCSSCSSTPSLQKTNHLYIDLPGIKDKLEDWIKTASVNGFWAHNAVQMTLGWMRDGLKERGITRDLKWGIPVPKKGYEKKVFYVWFDAPIGYISITGMLGDDIAAGRRTEFSQQKQGAQKQFNNWKEFTDYWWKNPDDVELFQFIGKDNIPFHTVIFPSSLLGSADNWTMLHHMSSTEYLNYENGKFSKSRGVGVFGNDAKETGIPSDVWRFYIFYNRPEKSDAMFTWSDFREKVNGELIGNFGNLVNRTLSFVTRYFEGKIPEAKSDESSVSLWSQVTGYEKSIAEKLDRAELRDAFREIFELSSLANKYFQDNEPWRLRNENPEKARSVIRDLVYIVRDLAVLIEPFLPYSAERIALFFGLKLGKTLLWKNIGKPEGIGDIQITSEVLFAKLEEDQIEILRERYSGTQKERNAGGIDKAKQFSSVVDLRAAKIEKVERHPKADKLYIINLETGEGTTGVREERQIVSGLVQHYTEEELLGKKIIVAYNLKPAKLRGVESRGMLLAAGDNNGTGSDGQPAERVEVLSAGDCPTGTRFLPEGEDAVATAAEIDIDTFFLYPIVVKDYAVTHNGKNMCLNGKPVRTSVISDGEVH